METWHLMAGAVGGFLIGAVLVGTLALDFPIDQLSNQYPSNSLPTSVHDAVVNSYLKQTLFQVFDGSNLLKILLIPDFSQR